MAIQCTLRTQRYRMAITRTLHDDPGYMSRKFESFERINSIRETNGNFDSCNSCERRAVHMSCMSQNFRLFHLSNLSVRNFRIFLLMYTGSMTSFRVWCKSGLGSCRPVPARRMHGVCLPPFRRTVGNVLAGDWAGDNTPRGHRPGAMHGSSTCCPPPPPRGAGLPLAARRCTSRAGLSRNRQPGGGTGGGATRLTPVPSPQPPHLPTGTGLGV